MQIEIQTLKSGIKDYIEVDNKIEFEDELLKTTDLLSLNDVKVKGTISLSYNDYYLSLDITGEMVLPCALTLKPVNVPFSIKIEDDYQKLIENIDEFVKKSENTLDIFPIIWENILMEIPMRVVSEKASPLREGNGWKFIDDEEINTSPFEKLNELLDRKEV